MDSKLRCVTGAGEVRVSDSTGSFKVVTGAGNLVIESFAGSLRASTGSGNVSATGEISSFNVNTGAGDVTIDSSAIKLKESSISTGAGNIYVFLDPDAAFDLDAGVKLGGISCDFPLLNMRSDKKKLLGHTGEGAQRLSLNTGIGDVNVRQK